METKLFLEECKRTLELAKETLRRAQKRYKKQAKQKPKAGEFQGRVEGVVECEEFYTAVGTNTQVHN